jgi:hypothetical protein
MRKSKRTFVYSSLAFVSIRRMSTSLPSLELRIIGEIPAPASWWAFNCSDWVRLGKQRGRFPQKNLLNTNGFFVLFLPYHTLIIQGDFTVEILWVSTMYLEQVRPFHYIPILPFYSLIPFQAVLVGLHYLWIWAAHFHPLYPLVLFLSPPSYWSPQAVPHTHPCPIIIILSWWKMGGTGVHHAQRNKPSSKRPHITCCHLVVEPGHKWSLKP